MTDAELYGETSTPEQDRKKEAKHMRMQVQNLMDAFHTLQQHGPRGVARLVFGDSDGESWYTLFAPHSVLCMSTMEDMQDAVSTPNPAVRPLWSISTEPFYTVPQAIRALVDATAALRRCEGPELVMSSLGTEQHERFMAEVDGYIETLETLFDMYAEVPDALYGDPAPQDAA